MKLERNLLAAFYSRLAILALDRDQFQLAIEYMRLANQVL